MQNNIIDLLDNVYVINLERSKDRLKHIDGNLRKFGIKYERFNAIDGKKLSIPFIDTVTTTMCIKSFVFDSKFSKITIYMFQSIFTSLKINNIYIIQ